MPVRPRPTSRLRTAALALGAGLAALGAVVTTPLPATAERPEVLEVDRTFVSPLLTSQCGVEVVQHLVGTYSVVRSQEDRTITNFRFRSTLTAGENVVDSRAFGPTIEVQEADGTLTVVTLGVTMRNLPGSGAAGPFAGREVVTLVLDEHGEVVEEVPGPSVGYRQDLAELCAALTA